MRTDRRTTIQLIVFGMVAVCALSVLSFGYAGVGHLVFGVGRYEVTVQLPQAAGLYDRANVTYLGIPVGRVRRVELTDSGVDAVLDLDSKFSIPADVNAEVHSQSAIGEQYVALVAQNSSAAPLRDGAVITAARTSVPTDINDLFDKANTALGAVPGRTSRRS